VQKFMHKGGLIAWGIVPTTPDAEDVTVKELEARFDTLIEEFIQRGFAKEDLLMHSVITPSCGTSPLTVAQSDSVLAKTAALSQKLREKYGMKRG
jgi:predicted NACHT family NTPase